MIPLQNCLAAGAFLLALNACSNNASVTEPVDNRTKAPEIAMGWLDPDEELLATVDGSVIGRDDLSVYMARTIGSDYNSISDPEIEQRVLQSLVASRAIALTELKLMPVEERLLMEKRVAQFREELLVKRYLLENTQANTISNDDIISYYEKNPDQFSGREERRYELLTVSPEDYKKDATTAIDLISRGKTVENWAELAANSLNSDNMGVAIKLQHNTLTLSHDNNATQSAVDKAVNSLSVGAISRIVFVSGAPYIVRLLDIDQQPAKTLEQARSEITKRLLPASIKKSVRAISEKIIAQSSVEYH